MNLPTTVRCTFPGQSRLYTYLTPFEVVEGDYAIIADRNNDFQIVRICVVDPKPTLDPNLKVRWKFLLFRLPLELLEKATEGTQELEDDFNSSPGATE
jgi:hypothetical protein